MKRANEFLNTYRLDAQRTQHLASTLKRLDLCIPRVITVQNKNGAKYNLEGFFVVDEQKLGKIDDKEAGARLRSGHLTWNYMHLLSMHNLADLSTRLDARTGVKDGVARGSPAVIGN